MLLPKQNYKMEKNIHKLAALHTMNKICMKSEAICACVHARVIFFKKKKKGGRNIQKVPRHFGLKSSLPLVQNQQLHTEGALPIIVHGQG